MTIQDIAKNLLTIKQSVDEQTTDKELQDIGGYVIGQATANTEIMIEDYQDQYPILDDIDSIAGHLSTGDVSYEESYRGEWDDLARYIEIFYKQVQNRSRSNE